MKKYLLRFVWAVVILVGGFFSCKLFRILDDPGRVTGNTPDAVSKDLDDTIEFEHSRIPDSSDIKSYFESQKRLAELKEIELLEKNGTRIINLSDTDYLNAQFKGVDAHIDSLCEDSIWHYYHIWKASE